MAIRHNIFVNLHNFLQPKSLCESFIFDDYNAPIAINGSPKPGYLQLLFYLKDV